MCLLRDFEIVERILGLGETDKNEITGWFQEYLDLISRACLFTHKAQGQGQKMTYFDEKYFFRKFYFDPVKSPLRITTGKYTSNVV